MKTGLIVRAIQNGYSNRFFTKSGILKKNRALSMPGATGQELYMLELYLISMWIHQRYKVFIEASIDKLGYYCELKDARDNYSRIIYLGGSKTLISALEEGIEKTLQSYAK